MAAIGAFLDVAPAILGALPALVGLFKNTKSDAKKNNKDRIIKEVLDKLQRNQNDIDRLMQNQKQANQIFQALEDLLNRMDNGALPKDQSLMSYKNDGDQPKDQSLMSYKNDGDQPKDQSLMSYKNDGDQPKDQSLMSYKNDGAQPKNYQVFDSRQGKGKLTIETDLPDDPREREEAMEHFCQMLGRIGEAYRPRMKYHEVSGKRQHFQCGGDRYGSSVSKNFDRNDRRTFMRTSRNRGSMRDDDYEQWSRTDVCSVQSSKQPRGNGTYRRQEMNYSHGSRPGGHCETYSSEDDSDTSYFESKSSLPNRRSGYSVANEREHDVISKRSTREHGCHGRSRNRWEFSSSDEGSCTNYFGSKEVKKSLFPLVVHASNNTWREATNFNEDGGSVWTTEYQGNVDVPEICFYSVNSRCRYEDEGCKRLHATQHFHWQVKERRKGWVNLTPSQVLALEEAFCDPSQEGTLVPSIDSSECSKEIRGLFGRDTWQSCFIKMELFNPRTNVTLDLRRLRSENINGKKIKASWNAWYFLDRNDVWVQYGNSDTTHDNGYVSNITSDDIEKIYRLNSKQRINFDSSKFSYTLDFNSRPMEQINTSTNARRLVKRRPVPHLNKSRNDSSRWSDS